MKLIGRYLKKHPVLFSLDFLFVFSFAIAELGIPTIFGRMVDTGIEPGNPAALQQGLILMLLAAIATTLGMICLAFVTARLTTSVVCEIRQDLFDHVMTFSVPEVETFGISSLITRTNSDAYQIMLFTNTLLRSAFMAPIMMVVSIVLIIKTSLSLSWIILGTLPFILAGAFFVFKKAKPLSETQQKSTDAINRILRENLSGIRVVRSFNRQDYEQKRFDEQNRLYERVSKKLFKLMSLTDPTFFFLMNIASILIYWFAAVLISKNQLQIGQLLVFTEYLFHCMMSVLVLCTVFMMYPRAAVSARRIQDVLNLQPSIVYGQGESLAPIASLEFKNVSFAYPNSKDHTLHNVSFRAHKGQKIAVIGATGSGKSSLVRLLCRFYDPQQGTIQLNGKDIKDYDLKALRKEIALVSQKAHLFSGTIKDNILFSNPNAGEEDLKKAIEISQSEAFIAERPDGLEDKVEEGGQNLSGGQKQRLSIARAIASKASLYILDDSYSALDLATDARLRKALEPVLKDALQIVVAQRISSIADSDLILVLDQGRIAAAGTHKELFKTSELYRQIVLSQMSEEEAASYA